jgi:hypothetical protein
MESGLWGMSDSVIAFDKKGNLVNGQHRMAALSACDNGIEIDFIVAKDWPSAADIDMGRKRHWLDAAALDPRIGLKLTHRVSGFVRAMFIGRGTQSNYSHRLLAKMVLDYNDAVQFLSDLAEPHQKKITVSPVFGAIGRAFFTEDEDVLKEFVGILKGDPWKDEHQIAAVKLRERLLTDDLDSQDKWYLTQNAIYNFCKGNVIKHLKTVSREIYSLPERKG